MEPNDTPRAAALDSAELSARYEVASEPQFTHGKDLIDLLAIRPGERVLDVGCGTGRLAVVAADRVGPYGRVIGIDPAPSRIELARRRGAARLEFLVGRAEDLSTFEDESFDLVYMNSVLNSLRSVPTAIGEVRRVLKIGGRFGIATTVHEPPNELRRITVLALGVAFGTDTAELAAPTTDPQQRRRIAREEVRSLLVAAGFEARIFELRTYLAYFAGVAEIIEFLRTTTCDDYYRTLTRDELQRFAAALERVIAEEVPASRRASGIQLERHVLLAVADKPAI